MPIGLIGAGVFAACAFLAAAPVRRPRSLAMLSFRLGLAFSELPFVAFALLLLATAPELAEGGFGELAGWVAIALWCATASALVVVIRRGLGARAEVDAALREAFGDGTTPRHTSRFRAVAAPFPAPRPRSVERVPDIPYGEAGARNTLDLFRGRAMPRPAPVLIHMHGGHFHRGRKSTQSLPLIHRFARRGWLCVSANYRLRPAANFPDYLVDMKRVIAWLRGAGADHGADPDSVFAAGSSAGGYLAAMAALTAGRPEFQPGFESADTGVAAAICLGAYLGPADPRGPRPSAPADFVGPGAPPFFVAHGDADTVVPVDRARALVAALREASAAPVVYAELGGAQHAFDLFHSLRFEAVVDGVEEFAARVRSRSASA